MRTKIKRNDGLATIEVIRCFDLESNSYKWIVISESHSGHSEDGHYLEGIFNSNEESNDKIVEILTIREDT